MSEPSDKARGPALTQSGQGPRDLLTGSWADSLAVVRGYFAYHAVPTNVKALQAFRTQVERHWQRSLRRRGQRDRTNWARMRQLSRRWLPEPKIQHPWPTLRFDVRTRGRSPVR